MAKSRGLLFAGIAGAILLVVAGAIYALGLFTVQTHQGYFAPAWGPKGKYVYFIQRDSFGVTWGLGWDNFTPPASAYVINDHIRLRRLERASGRTETLQDWSDTPVKRRVVQEYRGRIFNTMRARVAPVSDTIDFLVKMTVPRIPRSETFALKGRWQPGKPSPAEWSNEWGGTTGYVEQVLMDGNELIAVSGRESYPAAIVEVTADGIQTVLLQNDAFRGLYPDGIPAKVLAERSRRQPIERGRKFRRVKRALTDEYRAEGLNDGAARLKAYDRMEELGYLPRSLRLTAVKLPAKPPQGPVFEITAQEFLVGLFSDLEKAIAAPSTAVKKSIGKYVIHRDYNTSKRLNKWLAEGHRSFVVLHQGTYYRVTLNR